jgi:hypothetical protein
MGQPPASSLDGGMLEESDIASRFYCHSFAVVEGKESAISGDPTSVRHDSCDGCVAFGVASVSSFATMDAFYSFQSHAPMTALLAAMAALHLVATSILFILDQVDDLLNRTVRRIDGHHRSEQQQRRHSLPSIPC